MSVDHQPPGELEQAADDDIPIRKVGTSGQISLGKKYAGKKFQVETRADGTLSLIPVVVVRESQLWTLREPHAGRIAEGMRWAAANPAKETDLAALDAEVEAKIRARKRKGR